MFETAGNATLWELLGIDQFGNASRVKTKVGTEVQRSYEAATGRLLDSVATLGGDVLFEQHLSYDQRGLIRSRSSQSNGGAVAEETFEYDRAGRLRFAHSNREATREYRYNAAGNLVWKTDLGNLQYVGAGPHQVTHTEDGRHFKYEDGRGNQTWREGPGIPEDHQEIDYTAFDLPSEVVTVTGGDEERVRLTYDARNQRIGKDSESEAVRHVGELYQRTTKAYPLHKPV